MIDFPNLFCLRNASSFVANIDKSFQVRTSCEFFHIYCINNIIVRYRIVVKENIINSTPVFQ